ncbi:amino acid/amide ABC transporter substrate-binding protein (HAAT family) [Streptomyces sp. BK340]|nr:amino acid/amide ABC transporter substrate-binding protein (HAAT family) [Streptomyces sp. BK340]
MSGKQPVESPNWNDMPYRMKHRRMWAFGAVLTALLLVLTACSADNAGASYSRTVTIAVDAPLTGPLAPMGKGIANSVELAVRQANRTQEVPGITFKTTTLDDGGEPSRGKANAERAVGASDVIGMVGPLNSGVALFMQETLDRAHLTLVSPANTNPTLTLGPDWLSGEKVRRYPSYFRTVTTDASQGPFAAQFAYEGLGKKRVFVVADDEPYGKGLAATFSTEFIRQGGTVAGRENISPGEQNLGAITAEIAASNPDLVFFGGLYPECSMLSKLLKTVTRTDIPVMGGDAIDDPAYIKEAGKAAEGDYATSVGVPTDILSSARFFVSSYKIAAYKTPPGTYGAYAYDSAWAIVQGVKGAVANNSGRLPSNPRLAVTDAMQSVTFSGVTGPVSFDRYGDSTDKQLTVYVVREGKWTPLRTGSYVN